MASTPTPPPDSPTDTVSHEVYLEDNPFQQGLLGAASSRAASRAASTGGGEDEDFNARANRVRQRALEALEAQETTRHLLLQRANPTIKELKRLVAIDVENYAEDDEGMLDWLIDDLVEHQQEIKDAHNEYMIQFRSLFSASFGEVQKADNWWVETKRMLGMVLAKATQKQKKLRGDNSSFDPDEETTSDPSQESTSMAEATKMMSKVMEKLSDTQANMAVATLTSLEMADKPHIRVRKYNGKTGDFLSFKAAFNTAFTNKLLTEEAKFALLESHLEGEALKTIDGLGCQKGSLRAAWELLEEKFNNQDIIVDQLMTAIEKLEPVKDPNDLAKLQNVYDVLAATERRFDSMKIPSGLNTVRTWKAKFPRAFVAKWAEGVENKSVDPSSTADLLRIMKARIQALRILGPVASKEGQKPSNSKPPGQESQGGFKKGGNSGGQAKGNSSLPDKSSPKPPPTGAKAPSAAGLTGTAGKAKQD